MSKGKGRTVRQTLDNLRTMMLRGTLYERRNARDRIIAICVREGIDTGDYGVVRYIDPPEKPEEEEARWEAAIEELFLRINVAAPFIDAHVEPGKWPPSAKLKIMCCVVATGPNPQNRWEAAQTVLKMLDRARDYWKLGLVPDPFWNEENGLPPAVQGAT